MNLFKLSPFQCERLITLHSTLDFKIIVWWRWDTHLRADRWLRSILFFVKVKWLIELQRWNKKITFFVWINLLLLLFQNVATIIKTFWHTELFSTSPRPPSVDTIVQRARRACIADERKKLGFYYMLVQLKYSRATQSSVIIHYQMILLTKQLMYQLMFYTQ